MLYYTWRPMSTGQPAVTLEWMAGERSHQIPGLFPDLKAKTVSTWGESSGLADQASSGHLWMVAALYRVTEVTGPGASWASPTSAMSLGFASGSPRAVSLFSGLGFFRSPVLGPYKESHLVVPMMSPGTLDLHLASPLWLQLAPPSSCPKLIQTNSSRAQWGPWEEKGVKHLYWVYISQNTWKTVYRTSTPPTPSPRYLGLHLPVSSAIWKHDSFFDILSEGNE